MKKSRGNTRKILQKVGRIQDLTGSAIGAYQNDRAVDRADKLVPMLEEAFRLCLDILGEYEQINEPAPAAPSGEVAE